MTFDEIQAMEWTVLHMEMMDLQRYGSLIPALNSFMESVQRNFNLSQADFPKNYRVEIRVGDGRIVELRFLILLKSKEMDFLSGG